MTYEPKWTPGPWRVSTAKPTKTRGIDILAGYSKGVASAPAPSDLYRDEAERTANAHLIAAAPDLYAALKMAQLWLDVDGRFDMQGINATLAKARGEA